MIFDLISLTHKRVLEDLEKDDFAQALEFMDALVSLLESVSESPAIQGAVYANGYINILLDFVDSRSPAVRATISSESDNDADSSTSYEDIRITVSKIATSVTMSDENMSELSQNKEIIERFKSWMKFGKNCIEEDEIRMAGALCIGNIARSGIYSDHILI